MSHCRCFSWAYKHSHAAASTLCYTSPRWTAGRATPSYFQFAQIVPFDSSLPKNQRDILMLSIAQTCSFVFRERFFSPCFHDPMLTWPWVLLTSGPSHLLYISELLRITEFNRQPTTGLSASSQWCDSSGRKEEKVCNQRNVCPFWLHIMSSVAKQRSFSEVMDQWHHG